MHAVIRRYQFDPRKSEEVNRKVRDILVPLVQKEPGFVGYYWLDTGEGVGASVTVFEDEAGAEQSVRLAADFAQQHLAGIVGKPEVTMGKVQAHASGMR